MAGCAMLFCTFVALNVQQTDDDESLTRLSMAIAVTVLSETVPNRIDIVR